MKIPSPQRTQKACEECHDTDKPHGGENAKACIECHRENMPGLADYERKGFNHIALGYKHAMHGLCLTCHRLNEKDPTDPRDLSNCQRCHPLVRSEEEEGAETGTGE